jgi:SAM-dependent methyltransferase
MNVSLQCPQMERETTARPERAPATILWETTTCPLCAGSHTEPVIEVTDPLPEGDTCFHVVRCCDCELVYTNPRPTPESIGQFYPADYAPYQHRPSAHGLERWRLWPRRDSFAALLPAIPRGRLLDFGCGAGEILQVMDARGWQVTGLDFSPRMVRYIQEQLGLHAVEGTLPHPALPTWSFEAVIMAQSLEHVHNPLRVLREAHRLLTPGGKVVVAVPNIDSLPFRWFGADWWGLDVPRHLTHFAPGTLALMLERAGFQVDSVQLIRHNGWLRRSGTLAARNPDRHPLWRRLLRHRLPASIAGWYSVARKQAHCIIAVGIRTAA